MQDVPNGGSWVKRMHETSLYYLCNFLIIYNYLKWQHSKKKKNNGMLRIENIIDLPLVPSLKESLVDVFQEKGKLSQGGEKEL